MHLRLQKTIPQLFLLTGLLSLASALPAQGVIKWDLFKGPIYSQDTANVMPSAPEQWLFAVELVTQSPTDAGLITISGGNIVGSLPLIHQGDGEWLLVHQFQTQTALNAEFPSNATYTLTMTGGTVGLQIQTIQVGPEQYPNTPYLTGNSLSTVEQLNTANATTITWNTPSPLVQNSGATFLFITDRNDTDVFESSSPGTATSATVPANTLAANECHSGQLAFAQAAAIPPVAGGFPVWGNVFHVKVTTFEVRTWPFATAPCAWTNEFGNGCFNLELTSNDPIFGTNWDLTTYGIGATPIALTFFSIGEVNLPLAAFGIDAPGCSAYVDPLSICFSLGGTPTGGQLNLSIPLPATPSVSGMLLYAQTVATPLTQWGIGTSNAVQAMIGN